MATKTSQQLAFEAASKFAVVGASDTDGLLGNLIFAAALQKKLNVVPVNPNHTTVQGKQCYSSLHSIPDPAHTATFIVVGADQTLSVLQDAEAVGVPNLWLFTSGVNATSQQYLLDSGLGSKTVITPDTAGPCSVVVPDFLTKATSFSAKVAVDVTVDAKNPLKRKSEDDSAASPPSPTKIRKTAHSDSHDALAAKEASFLKFPKFAVVGASNDTSKWGAKIFKCLKEKDLNVVPVNPSCAQVQGVNTLKSISELKDPKNTALSIIVKPAVTLKVLRAAKELGIPMIWLQPGAEDAAVLDYITSAGLADRCLFTEPASPPPILNGVTGAQVLAKMDDPATPDTPGSASTDTAGPCPFGPSLSDAITVQTTVAATAVAASAGQVTTNLVAATQTVKIKPVKPCLFTTLLSKA